MLVWRVGLPAYRSLSHGLVVSEVRAEGDGATTVTLRGRRLDRLPVTGPDLMWADRWATALFVVPPGLASRFLRLAAGYEAIPL